jgi:hypothetical protein
MLNDAAVQLYAFPIYGNAGSGYCAKGGTGDLRAYPVAGDQSGSVGHNRIIAATWYGKM